VNVLVVRSTKVTAAAIEAAPQLSVIIRAGAGVDTIDLEAASARGIYVANCPGKNTVAVAELAIGLLVAADRRVVDATLALRNGAWRKKEFGKARGLAGRTLGILGFGAIGRRVAAMAHFGFGLKVVACDRLPPDAWGAREPRPPSEILADGGVERYTSDADDLFRSSDIVSIHLPSNASTRHFVNAARLAAMKPGALLVNTARGAVLDEDALYDALSAGRPAGAALDVFEHEPYAPVGAGKDLRTLENIVLTPHIGSNTVESNRRMGESCVANARHFLAGRLDRLDRVDIVGTC
jgi:D-3-phosphoglycerate dehydrogenase